MLNRKQAGWSDSLLHNILSHSIYDRSILIKTLIEIEKQDELRLLYFLMYGISAEMSDILHTLFIFHPLIYIGK